MEVAVRFPVGDFCFLSSASGTVVEANSLIYVRLRVKGGQGFKLTMPAYVTNDLICDWKRKQEEKEQIMNRSENE